jgi:hypothetical protein
MVNKDDYCKQIDKEVAVDYFEWDTQHLLDASTVVAQLLRFRSSFTTMIETPSVLLFQY